MPEDVPFLVQEWEFAHERVADFELQLFMFWVLPGRLQRRQGQRYRTAASRDLQLQPDQVRPRVRQEVRKKYGGNSNKRQNNY